MDLDDKDVLQVSRFKWQVTSIISTRGARGGSVQQVKQYTVKLIKEDLADSEDSNNEACQKCEFVNVDYDRGHSDGEDNESYCEQCDICACFYTCNCPDGHTLCEHVHKVHMLTKKV